MLLQIIFVLLVLKIYLNWWNFVMQKHFFFHIIDFVNSMECYKFVNIRPPYTYAFLIRCVSNQFFQTILLILFFLLYVNMHIYHITVYKYSGTLFYEPWKRAHISTLVYQSRFFQYKIMQTQIIHSTAQRINTYK